MERLRRPPPLPRPRTTFRLASATAHRRRPRPQARRDRSCRFSLRGANMGRETSASPRIRQSGKTLISSDRQGKGPRDPAIQGAAPRGPRPAGAATEPATPDSRRRADSASRRSKCVCVSSIAWNPLHRPWVRQPIGYCVNTPWLEQSLVPSPTHSWSCPFDSWLMGRHLTFWVGLRPRQKMFLARNGARWTEALVAAGGADVGPFESDAQRPAPSARNVYPAARSDRLLPIESHGSSFVA